VNVYVDHKQVYGMSCTIGNETTGDDEHSWLLYCRTARLKYGIVGLMVDHVYVRMRSFPAIICIDSY